MTEEDEKLFKSFAMIVSAKMIDIADSLAYFNEPLDILEKVVLQTVERLNMLESKEGEIK